MTTSNVALVTGASRGIGRAIARRLAIEGFDLTISARSTDTLEPVATELRALGARVNAIAADMSVEASVEALADAHLEGFRTLDLLIMCAGVGTAGAIDTYPLGRLDKQFSVNVRAPFTLAQRLLPILRSTAAGPAGRARIVAISSITGVAAEAGLAAYGASKAALISLCESITVEEADNGVSATAISPGYVSTDMSSWLHDRIDPNTMISADDVAEMVVALHRLSRYATVPNIVITRPGSSLWRA